MFFLYQTQKCLIEVGASCAIKIIKNHPFADGNKRTGFITMGLFFSMNKISFSALE